jgi:hypothetical protein
MTPGRTIRDAQVLVAASMTSCSLFGTPRRDLDRVDRRVFGGRLLRAAENPDPEV